MGSVVLIGKSEYDNLGTGYISAVLHNAGFRSSTFDLSEGKETILNKLKNDKPLVIGFSVIFQYHIDRFAELAEFLRANGINCHFTAGGHYATVRCEELLSLMPELDSVIRGEGEFPMLELAECLNDNADWRKIANIVFRDGENTQINPVRQLLEDLDRLPFPLRQATREYAFGKKFATLLAGRGCHYNCSFCNLRQFYEPYNVVGRRLRDPELVVNEIEYLYNTFDCSVFLFQDDDFPVRYKSGYGWVERFCDELDRRRLSGRIMWKINCRVDEIDENILARMKSTGLFLVFIGIEDGTDAGLRKMNKHLTVSESLRGINTLKKLGIGIDYGFMLFQPSTTYESLHQNLDFLKALCGDGYCPVTFLKMMPFYETRIEKELISQGRLKGEPGYRDYNFLELSMNSYFEFISDSFMEWTRDRGGLLNISKWALNYLSVCSRYFDMETATSILSDDLRRIISESNIFFLDILKKTAVMFESGQTGNGNLTELLKIRKFIRTKHYKYRNQIDCCIKTLITLAGLHEKNTLTFPGKKLFQLSDLENLIDPR